MRIIKPTKLLKRVHFINEMARLSKECNGKGKQISQRELYEKLSKNFRKHNLDTGFSKQTQKGYQQYKFFKNKVKSLIKSNSKTIHVPTQQKPHYQRIQRFLNNSQSNSRGTPINN